MKKIVIFPFLVALLFLLNGCQNSNREDGNTQSEGNSVQANNTVEVERTVGANIALIQHTPIQQVEFDAFSRNLSVDLLSKLEFLGEHDYRNVDVEELTNIILFLKVFNPFDPPSGVSVAAYDVAAFARNEFNSQIEAQSTSLSELDGANFWVPSSFIDDFLSDRDWLTAELRELRLNEDGTFTGIVDLFGRTENSLNLIPDLTKIAILDISLREEATEHWPAEYTFNVLRFTSNQGILNAVQRQLPTTTLDELFADEGSSMDQMDNLPSSFYAKLADFFFPVPMVDGQPLQYDYAERIVDYGTPRFHFYFITPMLPADIAAELGIDPRFYLIESYIEQLQAAGFERWSDEGIGGV